MAAGNDVLSEQPSKVTNGHANGTAIANGYDAVPSAVNGSQSTYPAPKLEIESRHIDDVRSLRAIVIGTGIAGLVSGILLPAKVPGIKLTILEKNSDVGGTWHENVYPGVRCDIPAHVYQASFSPRTQWTQEFAEGHEILDYWQEQARKYKVYDLIKFHRLVVDCSWNPEESLWHVTSKDTITDETHVETAEFLLPAIGRFNDWRLPKYPGMEDFKGVLRHTSNWDSTFNPVGKRVAVIGNGASGVQVVPNMQRVAKHVDHYARNKTWIAGSWAGDVRTFEPQWYSEETKKKFSDPAEYLAFRKQMEDKYWRRIGSIFRGSDINNKMRSDFIEIIKDRIAKKPDLLGKLVPDFNPNCRRLTPGPGYLESLTEDNVDYIQTPIKRFTATGIETEDGQHREVDAILCATGHNVDMIPPFPIRAHGEDIRDLWSTEGKYGWPYTYLGLAVPNFPNLLIVYGPHGAGPSGTVPQAIEAQVTYFAKVLRKVSSQGIKTIQPLKQAADDFVDYADAFFAKSVFTDNCSSWYNGGKAGQRINGIWPGSAAHVTIVRREPRWEDWEYEYTSKSGNRFAYFGDGVTTAELDPESDLTSYLKTEVDLRDVHESWWDLP